MSTKSRKEIKIPIFSKGQRNRTEKKREGGTRERLVYRAKTLSWVKKARKQQTPSSQDKESKDNELQKLSS